VSKQTNVLHEQKVLLTLPLRHKQDFLGKGGGGGQGGKALAIDPWSAADFMRPGRPGFDLYIISYIRKKE